MDLRDVDYHKLKQVLASPDVRTVLEQIGAAHCIPYAVLDVADAPFSLQRFPRTTRDHLLSLAGPTVHLQILPEGRNINGLDIPQKSHWSTLLQTLCRLDVMPQEIASSSAVLVRRQMQTRG